MTFHVLGDPLELSWQSLHFVSNHQYYRDVRKNQNGSQGDLRETSEIPLGGNLDRPAFVLFLVVSTDLKYQLRPFGDQLETCWCTCSWNGDVSQHHHQVAMPM